MKLKVLLLLTSVLSMSLASGCKGKQVTAPVNAATKRPPKYRLVDLGEAVFPIDINDNGTVVGEIWHPRGVNAFVWQNGKKIKLGRLSGYSFAKATKINNKGDIVCASFEIGSSSDRFSPARSYLWRNGKLINLGTLDERSNWPTDINNAGQIIGEIQMSSKDYRAVTWKDGKVQLLSTLGQPYTRAIKINDSGQLLGESKTKGRWVHPVFWENGRIRDLCLEGCEGSVCGFNSRGQVVGIFDASKSERHAFVWEDGKLQDLGTLGEVLNYPIQINDSGQVIGNSLNSKSVKRAFLWTAGKMIDLGTLGGPSSFSLFVNNQGQVIGKADTKRTIGDFPSYVSEYFLFSVKRSIHLINLFPSYGIGEITR